MIYGCYKHYLSQFIKFILMLKSSKIIDDFELGMLGYLPSIEGVYRELRSLKFLILSTLFLWSR